tara:strand:+ start:836 stop:1573 length:738 start_codon:yes stop_codon:yes gene_type:complete
MDADLELLKEEFDERGFLIIPDTLSAEQLESINDSLDRDLESNEWPILRSNGHKQDANILLRIPELDITVENPRLMPILTALVPDVSLDEFSTMFRDPTSEIPDRHKWHRDFNRDETYPFGIHAMSLVYYLSDVTESDHCFALVAATHNQDIEVKPGEHRLECEVDVIGPAGTAVFFHTACIHTAKLKPNSLQRRTIHIYYGHVDTAQISNFTDIPDRLRNKRDPSLPPKFYSKEKTKPDEAASD